MATSLTGAREGVGPLVVGGAGGANSSAGGGVSRCRCHGTPENELNGPHEVLGSDGRFEARGGEGARERGGEGARGRGSD